MGLTKKAKAKLYPISAWEDTAAKHPLDIEFSGCELLQGKVTSFKGWATINGKKRSLTWNGHGKCYYKGKRIVECDMHFND